MRDFFHTGLNVSRSDLEDIGLKIKYPGGIWYVSRNRGSISGDGRSWDQAFLTIGEAVTAVNLAYSTAAYPTRGRNTLILIDEGWYSETTMTLSASDCTIAGVAPGSRGNTVLYGSLTKGGWDDGNLGPALAITGWNCTIRDMDFVNRAATVAGVYSGGHAILEHPCILEGTFTTPVAYNRFVNLGFMRDQLDCASYGILSYSMDHTLIENCLFNGASLRDGGIGIFKGTGTNHSADIIRGNYFFGTPVGVFQSGGHNTMIHNNIFADQGAVTITLTNAIDIEGHSACAFDNVSLDTNLADFDGSAVSVNMRNLCSDTAAANWPAAA